MESSELFKLACQCLILDEHPGLKKGIKEKFISGEVDLDKFIHLCSNHLVLPAIYLRLQNSKLIELFPNEYADHLKEIYQLNRKRNLEILQQIDEINTQLNKEKIEPVYLKGTANLMDNLYSDIGERMIGDIDFLVRENDYLKAAELIMNLGYQHQSTTDYIINEAKHFPRLYKTDVPADIEIHRIPVNVQYSKQFTTEIIFQNKKAISKKENCYIQMNDHKVIHNFIHSQLSNYGYQYKYTSLRDLFDFHLLSKRVNLDEVLIQIEEKRKAKIFFSFAKHIFEVEKDKYPHRNKASKRFTLVFNWFLNHPKQHRFYINIIKANDIFVKRPFIKIRNAVFQKSERKSLYLRLKDPEWYKIISKGIKDHFL